MYLMVFSETSQKNLKNQNRNLFFVSFEFEFSEELNAL